MQDASIIRNRAKIQATVDNARAMMSASPSLAALAKSYEITRKRAPRSVADLPKSTPQAEAFAKQLKSQGYRFVGPTSVYAFMQNVGVVNDHVHGCFRATDYPATARQPLILHGPFPDRRAQERPPDRGSLLSLDPWLKGVPTRSSGRDLPGRRC